MKRTTVGLWAKHFAWLPVRSKIVESSDTSAREVSSLKSTPDHQWLWLTTVEKRSTPQGNEYRCHIRQMTLEEYDSRQY